MRITFNRSDKHVPFEKVLERIRENVLTNTEVTFQTDGTGQLRYELVADIADEIVTVALGL